jgi:putative peptidoglycan lipid II flippase
VVALIVAAILVAVGVNWFVGPPDDDGGGDTSAAATTPLRIDSAQDFDPHGTDGTSENPEEVSLAVDRNPATFWTTDDYEDPFPTLKPGVGIYFDLGESTEIDRVEVVATPAISFELRAADEVGTGEDDFSEVATEDNVEATTTIELDGEQGRYWLVWITSLPGGGAGRAGIAEVRFFGS